MLLPYLRIGAAERGEEVKDLAPDIHQTAEYTEEDYHSCEEQEVAETMRRED